MNKFIKKVSSSSSYLWIILAFNLTAIAMAIIWAIVQKESPIEYFEETEIMTLLSSLQLLILSGLCWKIANYRKQASSQRKSWKSPVNLWRMMTFGFVFLALDDYFEIHEKTDHFIHWILDIQETAVTDRIDDIILISYSVIGSYFIYSFWYEFKQYRPAFRFFIGAFILTAIMGVFDWYNNDETLVQYWITNPQYQELVYDCLQTVEESLKLIAEGVFISAFSVCLNLAKQMSDLAQQQRKIDCEMEHSQPEIFQNR
ncbi:MAG: hypothetical protein WBA77_11130 [Microcoleaceae cyanobacterium]